MAPDHDQDPPEPSVHHSATSAAATRRRRARHVAARGQLFSSSPSSWWDLLDPRQPEAFLAICSIWCSYQMWLWPDQFDATNGILIRQIGLYGHEQSWAVVGWIAALLKLAGLASRMMPRWSCFTVGLRATGLFLSVVFWMIVGLSTMADLPHSTLPIALTGLGVAAAFELAEDRDPRETWR